MEGVLRHPASQWVDLAKDCWRDKYVIFSINNLAAASLVKLGHTTYGLDIGHWTNEKLETPKDVVVIGYDVCHLYKKGVGRVHLAAGTIIKSIPEKNDPNTLAMLAPQAARVNRESVAGEVLKDFLSPQDIEGKIVIVHRDGRLTHDERQFWKEYHANLTESTTFVIVEVVKQGATPRLYDNGKNVATGKMLWISPREALLTASTIHEKAKMGTVKPLEVHLADTHGDTSMLNDDTWLRSVYDLTYLHHGTLMKTPRVPVSTFFSDRVAMKLAEGGEGLQAAATTGRCGRQQWYL